jgi:hypothetical protein
MMVTPCGGDDRIRTDDPLVANQVLYQLSYVPFAEQETTFPGTRRKKRNTGHVAGVPVVRPVTG